MVVCNRLVGHDRDRGAGPQPGDTLAEVVHQAASDGDIIASRIERDAYDGRIRGADRRGHDGTLVRRGGGGSSPTPRCAASPASASLTMASCGTSRERI